MIFWVSWLDFWIIVDCKKENDKEILLKKKRGKKERKIRNIAHQETFMCLSKSSQFFVLFGIEIEIQNVV